MLRQILKKIGKIFPVIGNAIKLDDKGKDAEDKLDKVIESISEKKKQKHNTDKLRQAVLMKVANAK